MLKNRGVNLRTKISIGLILSYTVVISALLLINNNVSKNLKEVLLLNEAKLMAETVIGTAQTNMHSANIAHIISSLSAIDDVSHLFIVNAKTKKILVSNLNKLKNQSLYYIQNDLKASLEKIDLTKRNNQLIGGEGIIYTSLFNAVSKDKKSIEKLIFIIRLSDHKVTGFLHEKTQILIFSAIIGLAFAVSFTLFLFKFQIYRPMNLLIQEIKHAHLNDKPIALQYKSHDEFGYLISAYNKLMSDFFENRENLKLQKELSEQAAKSKSDFLAVMSHEIRTPLNGVVGISSLLNKTHLRGEQKEYCETIIASGKQLLSVINDILDFSKIDAGKLILDLQKRDLNKILKTTVSMFEVTAKNRNIKLISKIEPSIKHNLRLDETRIRQVLVNLISNAFKFTKAGQVTILADVLQSNLKHCTVRFSVTDTGIGLSQSQIDKLFSKFVQADTSTTRKYGGTGLGLAICKSLVELMGGKIWIESELGKGASFIFDLSFEVLDLITYEAEEKDLEIEITGKKILLVEDVLINQKIVNEILKNNSLDIANDGIEAIDKVQQKSYEVILMDCLMPKMDGFEATTKIRELGITTPIIALTASALQETKDQCKEAGMDDYLSKPFDVDEIYKTLAKWL
ncbi:ATP-binding protein [Pseudoalteromonas denitrificans]|uniref:histidine kinase n=1 Tax=Pseudoalteromonas denitrificans DSM 6059 TaxID=1123010 RepID=A0A1I1ESS3_9GAMM|nr:ATP-binding protein [Pseudoalteromonas denitrificans]SFB89752.1 Signal transduction histidine kinase [Pseudoalteromonas denitrificans DSM 6059]